MKKLIFLISLSLLLPFNTQAKDFGKTGQSFAVVEEGFIEMIKRKLAGIDMIEQQRKMASLAKKRVNNPLPVEGIKRAEETRIFYFDPSYVLLEDIRLPGGQMLHKAGTKVNPLDHMQLERRIFFIDGRDEEQVQWLKKELAGLKKRDELEKAKVSEEDVNKKASIINRIVLTGGRILELQKTLNHELYFDQAGELTTKFGIKGVPAMAWQEGKRIKLKEVVLDD